MIFSRRNKSTGKAVLSLGLCFCLMMAIVGFTTSLPTDAMASNVEKGEHAVDQAKDVSPKKISKGDLCKDDPDFDWNYALYTLIIRFVGIFLVLGIIQVVIQISGRIFTTIEEKKKAQNAAK